MAATKSVNVGVNLSGKDVFATATGVKLGSKGKVTPTGDLFATLDKGTRRKLRKALHAGGHVSKAAEPATVRVVKTEVIYRQAA